MEYVYRIPLGGLSFADFLKEKLIIIRDGLNNKKRLLILVKLLKNKLSKELVFLRQIKEIISNAKHLQKDVELEYDGMLHIKVLWKKLCL